MEKNKEKDMKNKTSHIKLYSFVDAKRRSKFIS